MVEYRLSDFVIINGDAVRLPRIQYNHNDIQSVIDIALGYGDGIYVINVYINGDDSGTVVIEVQDGVYYSAKLPEIKEFSGELKEYYVYYCVVGNAKGTYKVSTTPKRTYKKVYACNEKQAIERLKSCKKI